MKEKMIRAIGVLLVVSGGIRAYACLGALIALVPIAFENGLASLGVHAGSLNLAMAAIGLAKAVGGGGVLWLKSWGKWTAAVAAGLHVVLLGCPAIPIWIRAAQGTLEVPAGIPMGRDVVAIGANSAIIIALFALFRKGKA